MKQLEEVAGQRKSFEAMLEEKFPVLCKNIYIGIGKGWHGLLYALIQKIQNHLVELKLKEDEWPRIDQIKEKFGGLRFYTSYSFSKIDEWVEAAEDFSVYICEFCGQPGNYVKFGGWVKSSCQKCYKELNEG